MSYLTQNAIAASPTMLQRIAQAASAEDLGKDPDTHQPMNPDRWAMDNRRTWAAAPEWDTAWEYAVNTHPAPNPLPENYVPYDPGADEAVITDSQILAQVQAMVKKGGPKD